MDNATRTLETGLRRGMRGMTVIELMIVITIIGILATWAIPSYRNMMLNNRRAVSVNELVGTLMSARGEVAKRGQAVVVCPTTTAAPGTCNGGTDWSQGWMSFVDVNGNGAYDAGTDTLLRQYANPYSDFKITLASSSTPSGVPATVVALAPFNQTGTSATIRLCDRRGATEARSANIAKTGRSEVSSLSAAGVPLDVDGLPLTCP